MAVGLVASPRKEGRYVAGIAGFTAGGIGPGHGACGDGGGGNTGPSGVPTRIVFQYAGSGGVFDDNVPVTPGTALLVRATPVDADGHVFAKLTENWSVAGGGALDAAVTTPAGGNDPTLNRWSIGPTTGVQLITVTLPAYGGRPAVHLAHRFLGRNRPVQSLR